MHIKMIGVYKITNPNGCIYIGSSKEIEVRFSRYKKLKCSSQPKLYNSLKKYGVDNHKFEVVEECLLEDLYFRENYYGNMYNVLDRKVGLNLVLPGSDDVKIIISEENRLARSLAQTGKKVTKETRMRQSMSQKGRKHADYTRHTMSINNIKSKLVIDLSTGIFYSNTREASESLCINRHYLKGMLNGQKKNKTNLIYCE